MIAAGAAAALAGALILLIVPPAPTPFGQRIEQQLEPGATRESAQWRPPPPAVAAVAGFVAGAALPAAAGVGLQPMAAVAAAGLGAWIVWARQRAAHDRAAADHTAEVPTVADALALFVLAGDPLTDAIARLPIKGRVADDLTTAVGHSDGFAVAVSRAAVNAESPHAARFYETLAQAQRTGARLADTLTALAADVRSAIGRDLTAEGGRRAIAAYGPVLALMVPTTLIFLMYPTVVGLTSLSGP